MAPTADAFERPVEAPDLLPGELRVGVGGGEMGHDPLDLRARVTLEAIEKLFDEVVWNPEAAHPGIDLQVHGEGTIGPNPCKRLYLAEVVDDGGEPRREDRSVGPAVHTVQDDDLAADARFAELDALTGEGDPEAGRSL